MGSPRGPRVDSLMDKFKGISLGGLRQASGGVLGLSRKAAVTLFLLAFFDSFIICKYWQTIVQPQERVTVTEPILTIQISIILRLRQLIFGALYFHYGLIPHVMLNFRIRT